MASWMSELQSMAMTRDRPLSDLLRTARFLAVKFDVGPGAPDTSWLEDELNGYGPDSPVPEYRTVELQPMQRTTTHGWLPIHFVDPDDDQKVKHGKMRLSVAELEALLDAPADRMVGFPFDPALVTKLQESGLRIVEGIFQISRSQVVRILDVVRGRVLDWSVGLERLGIAGDGLAAVTERLPPPTASGSSVIYNMFHGPVGSVQTAARVVKEGLMATPLDAKQAARLKVLNAFYELSDGDEFVFLEPEEIVKQTGLSMGEVQTATRYLTNEGLVEPRAIGGVASISHAGVREVEDARAQPGTATEHFSPNVTQFVFNAPVGAVQTGTGSIANVNQSSGVDIQQVMGLLDALRRAIPVDRADLRETVDDLDEEIRKPEPKQSKIRAYLASARDMARDYGPVVTLLAELGKILIGS